MDFRFKENIPSINIYLDDERKTPRGFIRVYEPKEIIILMKKFNIGILSLDHDLGNHIPTGYDFLCWLERKYYNNQIDYLFTFKIHSANSVGKKNMTSVIEKIGNIFLEKHINVYTTKEN